MQDKRVGLTLKQNQMLARLRPEEHPLPLLETAFTAACPVLTFKRRGFDDMRGVE